MNKRGVDFLFISNIGRVVAGDDNGAGVALKCSNQMSYFFGWLVVWVLWHINLCRLFNAKSILMQIVSSISNNAV